MEQEGGGGGSKTSLVVGSVLVFVVFLAGRAPGGGGAGPTVLGTAFTCTTGGNKPTIWLAEDVKIRPNRYFDQYIDWRCIVAVIQCHVQAYTYIVGCTPTM